MQRFLDKAEIGSHPRVANSVGLGKHPFISREHLNALRLNFPRRVAVKHEQPTPGARVLLGGSGERPQLACDCFR